MAELKTKKNPASVEKFLNSIKEEQKRNDSLSIMIMMEKASKNKPKMWGTSIVGFGEVHLKYESGRELDWFTMGFSPRKDALTLYGILSSPTAPALLKNLGKFKTGKGCLYIKRLADVDQKVLLQLMQSVGSREGKML
jgi:hypothetical protein